MTYDPYQQPAPYQPDPYQGAPYQPDPYQPPVPSGPPASPYSPYSPYGTQYPPQPGYGAQPGYGVQPGYLQQPGFGYGYPQTMLAPPTSGYATAALVLGIISWLGGAVLVLPSIGAIICGHIGLRATRDGTVGGRGQSLGGLILGYVSLVPMIVAIAIIISAFLSAGGSSTTTT